MLSLVYFQFIRSKYLQLWNLYKFDYIYFSQINHQHIQAMIQQKPSIQNSQAVQESGHTTASVVLTPELFMFRQSVIDILNHCKRNIKSAPFDQMQVDKLVQSNSSKSIDIYQQYFLIGIGSSKTRQLVCSRYERLVRENLINKDNLPPHMITGIINARTVSPSGGGSTASSGGNSAIGSAFNLNVDKSFDVGKLVATIISHTIQPSLQIAAGLGFLLEGTRNKNNGNLFVQLMEDVYSNLHKHSKKPIDRFLNHFISNIVNEIDYHEQQYFQYQKRYLHEKRAKAVKESTNQGLSKYRQLPSIMTQSNQENSSKIPDPPVMHTFLKPGQLAPLSKERLCVHAGDQDAKFGKCFICERGASNYDKGLFVPLCSMDCKNKLKRINQQSLMNDHFFFLKWIIQTLSSSSAQSGNGDEVMYSLLLREVSSCQTLSQTEIGSIMNIIINNFSLQAVGIFSASILALPPSIGTTPNKIIQNSALILSFIVRKFPIMMLQDEKQKQSKEIYHERSQQIIQPNFHNTKIMLLEMIRLLESLPIINNSLQLTLLKSLVDILSARHIPSHSGEPTLIYLRQFYLRCDCRVLEANIVQRIFNIASQYALFNSAAQRSSSNTNNTISSMQTLGTNTSLGSDNSSNAMSLGILNNISISGGNCSQTAISGLQELLNSIVKIIHNFDNLQDQERSTADVILQKKVKNYIQSKFVEDFNKKPVKAVNSLIKLFGNNISPKDIAILLRQNMEYETKIKKVHQKINKQEVGAYFGTTKKDKNQPKDIKSEVYWEFLQLLDPEFKKKEIDDCLRITLNTFKLPKEGQQVDELLAPLSLVFQPHLGFKQGNEATATYQIIMVTLMVQTATNPNVKQSEKLKFDDFKKFCLQFDDTLTEARMTQIYDRIKKRPLQIVMDYRGTEVFTMKYLASRHLHTDFWKHVKDLNAIQQKKNESASQVKVNNSKQNKDDSKNNEKQEEKSPKKEMQISETKSEQTKQQQDIKSESVNQKQSQKLETKNSIQVEESRVVQIKGKSFSAFEFQNIWQFIYMSLVNRNNLRGLQQSCIIYGKCQLLTEFQAFFNYLYKIYQQLSERSSHSLQNLGNQAKLIILRLAIDYSNCVVGRQAWLIILKIIYKLDIQDGSKAKNQSPRKTDMNYATYEYQASDKLFTRTNTFNPYRLKEFLQAMCEFSSSEVKTDKNYTRQIYILRHIAEIIEYNLQRFEASKDTVDSPSLWLVLWPTIRSYFKNICIHPRQEISMSAIDSYKQLTMKILKLHTLDQNSSINHTDLMSVYLYAFERSPAKIKDLITNVLLNVICKQIKSGWNQIYTILDISDSADKEVVMKVVTRIISDVGLPNVGQALRLHQIILKQLRIANEQNYQAILNCLWEVCSYFNRLNIWLQTLNKVKDIYKSTSHVAILSFMYKICNKCLDLIKEPKVIQNSQPFQIKNAQKIENEIQQNYMIQADRDEDNVLAQKVNLPSSKAYNLVYFQVFSTQMHILQLRNQKLFVESLNVFKELSLEVFWRNLGNDESSTGFLALWEMFLTSNNAVSFCYFLQDFLSIVFSSLSSLSLTLKNKGDNQTSQSHIKTSEHLLSIKKQIILWLIRLFIESSKDQILHLSQEQTDLNRSFSEILQQQNFQQSKAELVEFYLSSKDYESKSIQHLVYLKIFKTIYEHEDISTEPLPGDIDQRVLESLIDSYETASSINSKPLLRNFLWNNQFFKGQDYLPGLMKQELRSFQIIVRYFNVSDLKGKVAKIVINFIKKYTTKAYLLHKKYSKPEKKAQVQKIQVPIKPQVVVADDINKQSTNRLIQTLYQDLGLWITNSQQILAFALQKITEQVRIFEQHRYLNYRQMFDMCMDLSRVTSSQSLLKECSCLMDQLIDRIY